MDTIILLIIYTGYTNVISMTSMRVKQYAQREYVAKPCGFNPPWIYAEHDQPQYAFHLRIILSNKTERILRGRLSLVEPLTLP